MCKRFIGVNLIRENSWKPEKVGKTIRSRCSSKLRGVRRKEYWIGKLSDCDGI